MPENLDSELNFYVVVINMYPPLTSIYRYTEEVVRTFQPRVVEINLLFGEEGWGGEHIGIDIRPKFSKLGTLNHLAMNTAFDKVASFVHSLTEKHSNVIVHYTNQFSGIISKMPNTRVVSVQDSPYYRSGKLINRLYVDRLYGKISREKNIIVTTNALKEDLRRFGFTGNIEVIPLSYAQAFRKLNIDRDVLRKELGLPTDKKLILSVSSLEERKNLIGVKKTIDKIGEGYRLVRVGDPVGNSITFTKIDDELLNKIYNACDVFLFPSFYEGFGLPIVEAFASGLPVVTSRIQTIEEISNGAAVLVNPHDVDDIAAGVLSAISNREKLVKAGLQRAKNYTSEMFSKRLREYYVNMLTFRTEKRT